MWRLTSYRCCNSPQKTFNTRSPNLGDKHYPGPIIPLPLLYSYVHQRNEMETSLVSSRLVLPLFFLLLLLLLLPLTLPLLQLLLLDCSLQIVASCWLTVGSSGPPTTLSSHDTPPSHLPPQPLQIIHVFSVSFTLHAFPAILVYFIWNLLLLRRAKYVERERWGNGMTKGSRFFHNERVCVRNAGDEVDKWLAKCSGWQHLVATLCVECGKRWRRERGSAVFSLDAC